MLANLENSAVATGLERSVFIPVPEKGNAKECSNYHTIALGWEDPLEKEMATHSSVLAWRIPGMGEPGGLPSMQSRTQLKRLRSSSSDCSCLENPRDGGDGIPVELFQILKDDAVKVLHSICQQIWKTQQWPQDWKRSVFFPIPKKGDAKDCSNYRQLHSSQTLVK